MSRKNRTPVAAAAESTTAPAPASNAAAAAQIASQKPTSMVAKQCAGEVVACCDSMAASISSEHASTDQLAKNIDLLTLIDNVRQLAVAVKQLQDQIDPAKPAAN